LDDLQSPIDAFLLARLEAQGLGFSPPADRTTLIRRAYFDLIGLPPEPEQVDAFVAEDSPLAWGRLIDRLLSSPHYGERWGRHWLDAAGYVDTIGSDNDATIIEARTGIWKYRDYVVHALNDNKPYDRFLTEQIAGDELVDWRNADPFTPEIKELLIATGFLRQAADVTYAPELNTADIRHQVLYDTVQIVSTNVLGLTMHCARCHTHKFDPISHADYYRWAAIFAPGYNVQDWKHSKERYLPDVSPAEKKRIDEHNVGVAARVGAFKQDIAKLRAPFQQKLFDAKLATFPEPIRADTKAAVATPADKRTEVQKYLAEKLGPLLKIDAKEVDKALDESARLAQADLHKQIGEVESTKRTHGTIQAFWDVAPPSPSYLYRRGSYQTPGPQVHADVLAVLNDPQDAVRFPTLQADSSTSGYRTALADWLTQRAQRLTARVHVNRIWMHYFGRGIVETPDNFGISGMSPSHPKLLDWLAAEFVENGWNLKRLHRVILTSRAYQQVSGSMQQAAAPNSADGLAAIPEEVDPENLLLWRMPLKRLESEIVRDRVLATSGMLNPKPGGPPVPLKPFADGHVEIDVEKLADKSQQFRRSLYLFARRNYHLSEMGVFDQPVVTHNCTRRSGSAVVLQSLTMLNGKFLFEQAERFAARVVAMSGTDEDSRITLAFRLAFCRNATQEERDLSEQLLERQRIRYLQQEGTSESSATESALVDLCQMLMNANEFLYVP
jgi:hypothetical protein